MPAVGSGTIQSHPFWPGSLTNLAILAISNAPLVIDPPAPANLTRAHFNHEHGWPFGTDPNSEYISEATTLEPGNLEVSVEPIYLTPEKVADAPAQDTTIEYTLRHTNTQDIETDTILGDGWNAIPNVKTMRIIARPSENYQGQALIGLATHYRETS